MIKPEEIITPDIMQLVHDLSEVCNDHSVSNVKTAFCILQAFAIDCARDKKAARDEAIEKIDFILDRAKSVDAMNKTQKAIYGKTSL